MAEAASAQQAASATREDTSQQRAGRRRRTSAELRRAQQGASAAAAPAALDTLSRLQQLADASPQVAQLRRLQALAHASPQAAQLRRLQALADNHYAPVAQLGGDPEEEELIQGNFASAEVPPQRQQAPRANNHGLPDQLKSGIESLSGLSMDHVRVHYNSAQPAQPAQLDALAYAQGSDIHLAPGQEQQLPHEAWHVVQQAQGRVRPTLQMKDGVQVNDDAGLEREADVMGGRAVQMIGGKRQDLTHKSVVPHKSVVQARGVTLSVVKQAIGTGFRPTVGGTQESSDDVLATQGINCHFSVIAADPGAIHVSYYPADDADYKRKIIHYAFRWNTVSESFGPPSQVTANWKPYRLMLEFFMSDAIARMQSLAASIKRVLDAPPGPPDFIPVPHVDAPPLTNERYFGGPFPGGDDHETAMFKSMPDKPPVQRVLNVQHDATPCVRKEVHPV